MGITGTTLEELKLASERPKMKIDALLRGSAAEDHSGISEQALPQYGTKYIIASLILVFASLATLITRLFVASENNGDIINDNPVIKSIELRLLLNPTRIEANGNNE